MLPMNFVLLSGTFTLKMLRSTGGTKTKKKLLFVRSPPLPFVVRPPPSALRPPLLLTLPLSDVRRPTWGQCFKVKYFS